MPQVQVLGGIPSFGEELGRALGSGVGTGITKSLEEFHKHKQNRQALEGLTPFLEKLGIPKEGINQLISSGLDPTLVSNLASHFGQQQAKVNVEQSKQLRKKEEEQAPVRQGLNILNRQREILASKQLGPKLGGLAQAPKLIQAATKKGQKARSEYERLGKALISLSTNIPIRNRQEFETLAHNLFDPTMKEAEIEGTLDAMERILKGQLGESLDLPSSSKMQSNLEIGQTFSTLPKATDYPNGVFSKGNKRYKSDGKTWKEIK